MPANLPSFAQELRSLLRAHRRHLDFAARVHQVHCCSVPEFVLRIQVLPEVVWRHIIEKVHSARPERTLVAIPFVSECALRLGETEPLIVLMALIVLLLCRRHRSAHLHPSGLREPAHLHPYGLR